MNKSTKARKYNSPILQELFDEITPLEMEQAKNRMQLAASIEDLMINRGWSKSQLAEKLGKNPSEITKWLSGTQNFTSNVLTEIAFVFGVDVAALFGSKETVIIFKTEALLKSEAYPFQPSINLFITPTHGLSGNVSHSILVGENQIAKFPITTFSN